MSIGTTQSNPQDVEALREMAREFTEAINTGDVDRIMRFYGSSYVDVNLRNPVQSQKERRAYFKEVLGRGIRVAVRPDEIAVHGDLAFVRGEIVVTRLDSGATTELRYLEIAQKGPGGWKAVCGMDGPIQEFDPSRPLR